MKTLAVVTILIIASTARAQRIDWSTVPAPIRPPAIVYAPATYQDMRALAIQNNKPLIVFVGCPAREVPGAYTCRLDKFWGDAGGPLIFQGIVVSVPKNGDLFRTKDLPCEASQEDIDCWVTGICRQQFLGQPAAPVQQFVQPAVQQIQQTVPVQQYRIVPAQQPQPQLQINALPLLQRATFAAVPSYSPSYASYPSSYSFGGSSFSAACST